MIPLDMRSLLVTTMATNLVCLLVVILLWVQNRRRYAGTVFWVTDFAFQTVAVLLIVLRGVVPDWLSMVLSNTLVIGGAWLGLLGLERFFDQRGPQAHNAGLLVLFAAVHAYFTVIRPDLAARTLNLSLGLLIFCGQCAWLLLYRLPAGMRRLTLAAGMVFGAYCLVSLARIGDCVFAGPGAGDYFHSGPFATAVLVIYQTLFILLTYCLALMVNQRLLGEIANQEEKFSKAFHSSPYAIIVTRLSDGKIIEVNDGFGAMTGYRPGESIGRTTLDLHFWAREEERAVVVEELSGRGRVRGREILFRTKGGDLITGLFSADVIEIGNERCLQSNIADITDRKRREEEIRALAIRDPLTGLYNRRGFISLAEQQLKVAERNRKGLCLFYLDLDDMKTINDRCGHLAGDEALKETAAALRGVFRESDVLARIGGDEFAVLALDASPEFSRLVSDRLQERLAVRNAGAGSAYRLSLSLGMAYGDPAIRLSLDELMARADEQMYARKRSRQGNDFPR